MNADLEVCGQILSLQQQVSLRGGNYRPMSGVNKQAHLFSLHLRMELLQKTPFSSESSDRIQPRRSVQSISTPTLQRLTRSSFCSPAGRSLVKTPSAPIKCRSPIRSSSRTPRRKLDFNVNSEEWRFHGNFDRPGTDVPSQMLSTNECSSANQTTWSFSGPPYPPKRDNFDS